MPLVATQRAFRDLVFRASSSASVSGTRRRRILRGIPRLGGGAARSLEAIPPDRLGVYHSLVVGGHQSMLGFACGSTVALLLIVRAERPRLVAHGSFRDMIEGFLLDGPAKSHSLRDLAARFGRFLRKTSPRAFAAVPALGEVLQYELAELAVDLEPDGPGVSADEARLRTFTTGTVDRLLRTRALVPSYARFLRFQHDIPGAIATLRRPGTPRTLARTIRPELQHVVMFRDRSSLKPTARIVPADMWRDLRVFRGAKPFPLDDLASRRARRGPRGETAEHAAGRVVSELLGWLQEARLLLAR